MRAHGHVDNKRTAFTLIELLVVIAIIAILAAILFPVFSSAKSAAKNAGCLSNLKQIGVGMNLYMGDWEDTLPLDSHLGVENAWITTLLVYTKSKEITRCPVDPSPNFRQPLPGARKVRLSSYGTSFWLSQQNELTPSVYAGYNQLSKIATPASTIYLAELRWRSVSEHFHPGLWYPDNEDGIVLDPNRELQQSHHAGRANYLFADWHAKALLFPQTFSREGGIDLYDPRASR